MQCDAVRRALQLARYEAAPLEAAAQSHLRGCEACGAAANRAAALDALLDRDVGEPPRPGFDTRFFARLEERRQAASPRAWLRRLTAGIATVAAAAAATAVVLLALPSTEPAKLEGELELAMELEMIEDLDLLRRYDEVEAFELLAQVDLRDLDAILNQDGDPAALERRGVRP